MIGVLIRPRSKHFLQGANTSYHRQQLYWPYAEQLYKTRITLSYSVPIVSKSKITCSCSLPRASLLAPCPLFIITLAANPVGLCHYANITGQEWRASCSHCKVLLQGASFLAMTISLFALLSMVSEKNGKPTIL